MALLTGTAGAQPADDNTDLVGGAADNSTMNGEAPPDAGGDDESDDDEPTVLCTVMVNKDGTYSLVKGDEPDSEDGLAAPEGASPAEGGTPALPEGQTFDGVGPLLKAILDMIRENEGGSGGDDGQSSFEDGFKGGKPDA